MLDVDGVCELITRAPAANRLTFSVHGLAAHAGVCPEEGLSAIQMAAEAIAGMRLGGKRRFNGLDLAHALSEGARTAYGAVAKPVEGTILTVIREAADAAVLAAERDDDIETVLGATVDAAEKSVARTPSLLAILREAGVVDSGGQGLYRLFQGALLHLLGRAPAGAARDRVHAGAGAKASALVAHADLLFIECVFLDEDRDQAARKCHLTARQAGTIARAARAKRVVPFHFSPRYADRERDLRDELESARAGQ